MTHFFLKPWLLFLVFVGWGTILGPALARADISPDDYREISWQDLVSVDQSATYEPMEPEDSKHLERYLRKRNTAPANQDLNRTPIKITGFVVPLERTEDRKLTDFLLVPYYGACIHVPPPPENQTLYVRSRSPIDNISAMDVVTVYGSLRTEPSASSYGNAGYTINPDRVTSDARSLSSYLVASTITLVSALSICVGVLFASLGARANPRVFAVGISFAAGIMVYMGGAIVSTSRSLENTTLFVGAIVCLFLLDRLVARLSLFKPRESGGSYAGKRIALVIGIHNLPECIAVFGASLMDPMLGLLLGCAMIAHSIPMGFAFSLPNRTYWTSAILAGAIPAVGAIILYGFLDSLISPQSYPLVFSFVAGVLIFIAVRELLPLARQHGTVPTILTGVCLGIAFMVALTTLLPIPR